MNKKEMETVILNLIERVEALEKSSGKADADDGETKILFGMHKGKTISECSVQYLDWLIAQDWVEEKFPTLKEEVEKHLKSCPKRQNK